MAKKSKKKKSGGKWSEFSPGEQKVLKLLAKANGEWRRRADGMFQQNNRCAIEHAFDFVLKTQPKKLDFSGFDDHEDASRAGYEAAAEALGLSSTDVTNIVEANDNVLPDYAIELDCDRFEWIKDGVYVDHMMQSKFYEFYDPLLGKTIRLPNPKYNPKAESDVDLSQYLELEHSPDLSEHQQKLRRALAKVMGITLKDEGKVPQIKIVAPEVRQI